MEEPIGLSIKVFQAGGHRLVSLLRGEAVTTIMVKEADKLTEGQDLILTAPHSVEILLWSTLD